MPRGTLLPHDKGPHEKQPGSFCEKATRPAKRGAPEGPLDIMVRTSQDHFKLWVSESAWSDEDLETQVEAYVKTYPGRVQSLLVELLEQAADRENDDE